MMTLDFIMGRNSISGPFIRIIGTGGFASKYKGLIDKLYDYSFGDNAAIMGTYFETWME
jgi:hypothetical protein